MDPLLQLAIRAVNTHEKRDVGDFDDFPIATYVTDAAGVVRHYNRACISFAGRVPRVGIDKWCISWELYTQAGQRLPHEQCPMAISIREKRAVEGITAFAVRPDRTSVKFEPAPMPLFNDHGGLVGAVNLLHDVGGSEQPAALWAEAARCRRLARSLLNNKSVDHLKGLARGYEQKATALEMGRAHSPKPVLRTKNRLLHGIEAAAIGEPARIVFRPGDVVLCAGEPINDIYFIESGLASAVTRYGARSVDVGMIGSEGMIGYERLLGAERAFYSTIMRFGGSAIRIPAVETIRLNKSNALFDERKLSFVSAFCKQLAENCAANALLSVESRLARWLLAASTRLGSQMTVTHEVIASAIGARRAGVTMAIHVLEGTKAIRSTRGRISVLDPTKLAESAKSRS